MTQAQPETLIIPFGGEYLALSRDQLEEARQRARDLLRPPPERQQTVAARDVFDAAGMEAKTGVPATWWLEQARGHKIPHIRAGKYVRFELDAVLQALRHADGPPAVARKMRLISAVS